MMRYDLSLGSTELRLLVRACIFGRARLERLFDSSNMQMPALSIRITSKAFMIYHLCRYVGLLSVPAHCNARFLELSLRAAAGPEGLEPCLVLDSEMILSESLFASLVLWGERETGLGAETSLISDSICE